MDQHHKIKTIDELLDILDDKCRSSKTVVMCHGVFDIVHPGHIRHLIYAKSKADILVASLTADVYVDKAMYRPFVPQDIRALNLAVLEMVDYVIIDENPTPLENLRLIKPAFFAKGYEYQASGVGQKTQEEVELIAGYGGEVLFTPGDVVFSSSSLLEQGTPDLGAEKLAAVMRDSEISFAGLVGVLGQFRNASVHVVGDTIVDTITHTALLGSSGKTPTLSVQTDSQRDFVGGAAVVALHLAAAGAKVTFTTVLSSDDPLRHFVLAELCKAGIQVIGLDTLARPITRKNVFVCGDHRLLKVDTVDNRPISDPLLEKICHYISTVKAEAVVFSDFRHGIFNSHTIPVLSRAIPPCWKIADSQVASRWGNIADFKYFDLLTPNEREARFAMGDQDTGVLPLMEKLVRSTKCHNAIMKLGAHGVVACEDLGKLRYGVLDSFARRVVDPVGAGDALLAYATLGLIYGSGRIGAILGNVAAALECEVEGNIPITNNAVAKRLEELRRCALPS